MSKVKFKFACIKLAEMTNIFGVFERKIDQVYSFLLVEIFEVKWFFLFARKTRDQLILDKITMNKKFNKLEIRQLEKDKSRKKISSKKIRECPKNQLCPAKNAILIFSEKINPTKFFWEIFKEKKINKIFRIFSSLKNQRIYWKKIKEEKFFIFR